MLPTQRQIQVSRLIRAEISDIIRKEMRDPRLGFVTITDVEASVDLRHAKVYVSVLGGEEEERDAFEAVSGASAFIRRKLAERITLKFVPELHFRLDRTPRRAARIAMLLQQVRREGEGEQSPEPG